MDNIERNATIIEMRRSGLWPRQIALSMGLSKNVVAGVLNRAGLTDTFVDRPAAIKSAFANGMRSLRGEETKNAKLTDDVVRYIRARYVCRSRVDGAYQIARDLGVSHAVVGRVVTGVSWKHVK